MADVPISLLPPATTLTGAETFPVVQSSATVQASLAALAALGGGYVPDATSTVKGKVRLTNHLGGTADAPTVPGLATKANDADAVHKTGNETIAGIKTFATGISIPNDSIGEAAVLGLLADLANRPLSTDVVLDTGNQTVAGVKTFSSAPVVPSASFPIAATSGLQTALDGKADESLLTAAGDLYVASASGVLARLATGTRGQVLTASPIPGVKVRWEPKPKVHIRDHGALLDGGSNDRQPFIDALAALPTHGGVVQFGPDIPVVYSTIPVSRQNVSIEGIGKALVGSTLLPTSCIYYIGTGPLFDFSDSISSGLSNVAIRGTGENGSKGVWGEDVTNMFLSDVWVDGMKEQGIHLVSGVHCQLENVWVENVLQLSTGRTAYVGAVDIGTTDAHLHNVIAAIGNASAVGDGWRAAIVMRNAPWNLNACIGQVSEAGIVIETDATNGRCGGGTRADFNFGHGWVVKGAGNVFVAPLAHHNSTDAALQGAGQGGDGFNVTGGKNTFIAPIISEIFGSTTKQRDGIRDTCSDDTGNPKSGNVYAFTRCEPTDIRGDVHNITGTAQHHLTEAYGADLRIARGGLRIKEGTNAKQGTATLVAGTVTVANTSVTANSRIFVQRQTDGGTVGASYSITRSAGTNFTITAKDGAGANQTADTSVLAWEIFEPA